MRSQIDDVYKRDQKILGSDKENVFGKRETETLILGKDSGKQFTSGGSSVHLRGGEDATAAPFWTGRATQHRGISSPLSSHMLQSGCSVSTSR